MTHFKVKDHGVLCDVRSEYS